MIRIFKRGLLFIVLLVSFSVYSNDVIDSLNVVNESDTLIQAFKKRTISVISVGDMMIGTNFPRPSYLPPQNNPWPLLSESSEVLKTADIRFGNLEGCFLDEGPVVKRCSDTTKCYAFRMPTSYAASLSKAGFNMLSIANNHINDFGDKGIDTTLAYLSKFEISNAGLKTKAYDTLRVDGLLFGMLAVSPFKKTVDMNNHKMLAQLIQEMDAFCDIIMISFHGGAEGKDHMNITRESEFFYGEDRGNVYEFAHMCIDAGADLVVGHGPHVPRAVELYNGRFISYSLGNFCTYARFNLNYPNSLAPILKVEMDEEGKALKAEIISMIQSGEGGPRIDELNRAYKLIQRLTLEDFPENQIVFEEDGKMSFPKH